VFDEIEVYTRELLLAEDVGFDAIALNEHHEAAYSMMPAVGIRAAYMAALTSRIKLLVAGPGLRSKVVVRENSAAHVGDTPGVREKERSR
jgi:alkanesulfonate monooxygenase SsuD/methylene tetrahydromethanopterin reductase-like flavin-dependent oxidoreductase (luciferase family)